jgi:hypothetical protein
MKRKYGGKDASGKEAADALPDQSGSAGGACAQAGEPVGAYSESELVQMLEGFRQHMTREQMERFQNLVGLQQERQGRKDGRHFGSGSSPDDGGSSSSAESASARSSSSSACGSSSLSFKDRAASVERLSPCGSYSETSTSSMECPHNTGKDTDNDDEIADDDGHVCTRRPAFGKASRPSYGAL